MGSFRLRHSHLRGAIDDRLRGQAAGAAGIIYTGLATAGIVIQPHKTAAMMPDPRPRIGLAVSGGTGQRIPPATGSPSVPKTSIGTTTVPHKSISSGRSH